MKKQIRAGSKAERDEVIGRLVAQRYAVILETAQETHLALPRLMYRDIPLILLLMLCGIIPGIAYFTYLHLGPRREVIVTIAD